MSVFENAMQDIENEECMRIRDATLQDFRKGYLHAGRAEHGGWIVPSSNEREKIAFFLRDIRGRLLTHFRSKRENFKDFLYHTDRYRVDNHEAVLRVNAMQFSLTRHKLGRILDKGYACWAFSQQVRAHLEQILDSIDASVQASQRMKGLSGPDIYRKKFERKPHGKVLALHEPLATHLLCGNLRDYVCALRNVPQEREPRDEEYTSAESTLAVALHLVKEHPFVPVRWGIFVEKGAMHKDLGAGRYVPCVYNHEGQHVWNWHIGAPWMDVSFPQVKKGKWAHLRDALHIHVMNASVFLKGEILSCLREGRAYYPTRDQLLKSKDQGGSYDFTSGIHDVLKGSSVGSLLTMPVQRILHQDVDRNFGTLRSTSLDIVKQLLDRGWTHDELADRLAPEPIDLWPEFLAADRRRK